MFTIEELKAMLPQGHNITDEQLATMLTAVNNAEQAALSRKIGELHGQYDADVASVTGLARNNGEKSYDFVKRVLGDYKTQLETANAKVASLEGKIAEGSTDEQLKQNLADAKRLAADVQGQLTAKEAEITKLKESHAKELVGMSFDSEFAAAAASLKFKAGISEAVQSALLQAAKREILAKGNVEVNEVNGVKTVQLRDANNEVLRNKNNAYNPYTVSELLRETSLKDVLDNGTATGGGTTPPGGGGAGGGGVMLDLTNIRTQLEADTAIENYLLQKGLTRDQAEFSEQAFQLRQDNKVAELPLR